MELAVLHLKNLHGEDEPSISSGSRAQRPVGLPVNHPEGRGDEEVGPAAHPHERHGGLPQVLHLFQPLPGDHHPWPDLPRGGERSFGGVEDVKVHPDADGAGERYQRLIGLLWVCFQVSHLEDIVEQTGYVLEKDSEYSQKILEEEEEITVSVTQKGGRTFQHQVPSSDQPPRNRNRLW